MGLDLIFPFLSYGTVYFSLIYHMNQVGLLWLGVGGDSERFPA